MAADRSRLAAALAYKQAEEERRRRMLESIPTPAGTAPAEPAPQADFRTNLENLSIGVGEGLTNQLEGIKGLVTDPVGTAKGVYEAGKAVVRDPAIIASALRQMGQKAMSGPLGAGEVIGEMIGPRKTGPVMAELDVYHGTPHRFPATEANPLGEFDASKIGTGEGAQAYGHGIYFAESPDVAKSYASMDSPFAAAGLKGPAATVAALAKIDGQGNPVKFLEDNYESQVKKFGKQDVDAAIASLKRGNLYTADLPDEMIDRMLDWDKPFLEQSDEIKKFAKNSLPAAVYNQLLTQRSGDMVEELAKYKGGKAKASELMRQAGIPGIKYLDEGSRNTAGKWIAKHPQGGETAFNTEAELNAFLKRNPEMAAVKPKQTRNFVVFPGEEKKVRILERK